MKISLHIFLTGFILFTDDSANRLNISCFSEMNSDDVISFSSDDSKVSTNSFSIVHPEVKDLLGKCYLNGLKFNNPMTCLENTLKILNQTPGAKLQLPSTKYRIRRSISLSKPIMNVKNVRITRIFVNVQTRIYQPVCTVAIYNN